MGKLWFGVTIAVVKRMSRGLTNVVANRLWLGPLSGVARQWNRSRLGFRRWWRGEQPSVHVIQRRGDRGRSITAWPSRPDDTLVAWGTTPQGSARCHGD